MNAMIAAISFVSVSCALFDGALTQFVCDYEGVEEAYCLMYEDIALIAAKVQPIFSRSQARAYREELARAVKQKFSCKKAVVSTDSDIFYLAKKASSSDLTQEEIERLVGNALKRAGMLE